MPRSRGTDKGTPRVGARSGRAALLPQGRRLWWCCLVLGIVGLWGTSARLTAKPLVRIGDEWRFFLGRQSPSEPSGAWKEPGFNDASWESGPSGFSYGYGSYDGATRLTRVPPDFVSAYFRRAFWVTDPAAVHWLVLRLDYADGFVAYLNGKEIARAGLGGSPGEPVAFDQPAVVERVGGSAAEFDVSSFASDLKMGTNVLALEVHSKVAGKAISAVPELLANFTRGPFLANMGTNTVRIIWRTPVPADSRVEYGRNSAWENSQADPSLVTEHVVRLDGLAPDSEYIYRVGSDREGKTVWSDIHQFQTFKIAGPVDFVVVGDSGLNSVAQYQIAQVMEQTPGAFVLHTGDVSYPAFTSGLADLRCFSVYQADMARRPYYFAIGNHDMNYGLADYLAAFYLPTNDVPPEVHAAWGTSPEHYYSFNDGDVHVSVLYLPFFSQYRPRADDPQFQWLTRDLAGATAPWKFIVTHLPLMSSSGHRLDDYDANGRADRLDVMDLVLPLAAKYGVQMVFSGHDHVYERFAPTNGVTTVVTGGGGAWLYSLVQRDIASAQFWPIHHCLHVQVKGANLRMEALNTNGVVFDTMNLFRGDLEHREYPASWHTIRQPTGLPPDGDGNRVGETFDLVGQPIPTRIGAFSNLGEVYVDNDATNLYVGFHQTAFYPNDNVFLFLGAAGAGGVTSMRGLGDGVLDPAGQGADGLDFLENLSFTGFTPAIAAILGDEMADQQDRGFLRPGMSWAIGQGVFRLDAAFSDVPGSWFEQFNRSPNNEPVEGEENADLIEVAIPLSALGGVGPGDTIQLGAVVGGGEVDTNQAVQARTLDRSLLGLSLTEEGAGSYALEPVTVRLAGPPSGEMSLRAILTGAGQVELSWNAVVGDSYQLIFAEKVTGPYTPWPEAGWPRQAVSDTESVRLDLGLAGESRRTLFFQLEDQGAVP